MGCPLQVHLTYPLWTNPSTCSSWTNKSIAPAYHGQVPYTKPPLINRQSIAYPSQVLVSSPSHLPIANLLHQPSMVAWAPWRKSHAEKGAVGQSHMERGALWLHRTSMHERTMRKEPLQSFCETGKELLPNTCRGLTLASSSSFPPAKNGEPD